MKKKINVELWDMPFFFFPEVIPIKKAICGRTEKGVMGAKVSSSLSLSE